MLKKAASCVTTLISLLLMLVWIFSMWESHVEDKGIALIAEGNKLIKAGDPASLQKSIQSFTQAAKTFHGMTSAKEARNEGIAYYNLARAYHALKQNDQAVSAGQRALPLFSAEDAKTRILAAEMYNNLGIYYIALNQPEKALDAYAHADSLYQTSGLQDKLQGVIYMEGALRYDEATAAVKKHDWTTARDTCLQAQHFFEQAKKPMDEADAYHKLNFIYTQMGDATHAAEAGRQEQALRSKK